MTNDAAELKDELAKLSLAGKAVVVQNIHRKFRHNTDSLIDYRKKMMDGTMGDSENDKPESLEGDMMLRDALVLGDVTITEQQPQTINPGPPLPPDIAVQRPPPVSADPWWKKPAAIAALMAGTGGLGTAIPWAINALTAEKPSVSTPTEERPDKWTEFHGRRFIPER